MKGETMPPRIGIVIALAGAGLIALAGCKDEAASMSSPDALLARQHKVWNNAREALRADRGGGGAARRFGREGDLK